MLMTARQIADHTGVCVRTIYRMMERGELPHYKIGRQIRYKLEEIEEATKCQKRQNGAP